MTQTIRQRRVLCERDLKPSRADPAVLRIPPPAPDRAPQADLDDAYRPGPLGPAVILIILSAVMGGLLYALAFGFRG